MVYSRRNLCWWPMYTFLAAQRRENFQMTACRLFKGNFEIAEKIKILCGKILIFCKTRRRFKIVWTLASLFDFNRPIPLRFSYHFYVFKSMSNMATTWIGARWRHFVDQSTPTVTLDRHFDFMFIIGRCVPRMFTSLYHRRAGVKHSAYTEEDVDCSIMNASASSCDVNRGDHASTGRDVRRAKMDISHHIDDARTLFGAFETSTGVLLYLLSTASGADRACTRDVDVRTYLRCNCKHDFWISLLRTFLHLTHSATNYNSGNRNFRRRLGE